MEPVSEDEMITRLAAEIHRRYPTARTVQDPDYRKRKYYPRQWNQIGSVKYWKRPGDLEPILAATCDQRKLFFVDEKGLPIEEMRTLVYGRDGAFDAHE